MQNNLSPITVKKEGVSDDSYRIIELYAQNGSWVKEGDLILCFETSKTAIDIESPADGYVFFDAIENEEVSLGRTIAVVSDEESFSYEDWFCFVNDSKKEEKKVQCSTIKISKPAQRLIDQNDVDISVFKSTLLITREDVENHLTLLKSSKINHLENLEIDTNSILIFGGGGHSKMCIDIMKQTQTHSILGIVDDNISIQKRILDVPIIGDTNSIDELVKRGLKNVILGVGGVLSKGLRKKLFLSLKNSGLYVPTIIHPDASVEPSAVLGEGNQIMQGAIIGSNVQIGNNCIINSGSIISHDTIIGNNVHIAPGAIIAGGAVIKDDTIIGMGCTIFLGLTIGENVIIQNGVNVFMNIEDGSHIKQYK